MTAPRTRRQLREALNTLNASYQFLGQERDEAKSAAATHESENRRLRADYAAAQTKLNELGYEISIDRSLAAELGLVRPAEKWQPKQGITSTLTTKEHERILDQRVGAATDATRRNTLSAVIKALELTTYGYRKPGRRYLGGVDHDAEAEAFWADIQTTLEVREEKRVAAERAATEEKVAGLRKRSPITLGFDLASGGLVPGYAVREFRPGDRYGYGHAAKVAEAGDAVTLSDHDRELLESIKNVSEMAANLGVNPSATAEFTETVEKLSDEPSPAKKSAKKKPENQQ